MEKKSDIQKPASHIRKPSKTRETKVITSDMRKEKNDGPESQESNNAEKEKAYEKQKLKTEQEPVAQQENRQRQSSEQKIVNEDEQKQVVNNPVNGGSPTEAEDQK